MNIKNDLFVFPSTLHSVLNSKIVNIRDCVYNLEDCHDQAKESQSKLFIKSFQAFPDNKFLSKSLSNIFYLEKEF